ncbi:hypothetical protein ACIBFB_25940 [Nocardiopsis sp. NPDC050513]|uniref:hypothetical protein n=1 Tax=Nocardiopsis sp. NPDC050513 TaxID=3364338 RepID=UPI00378CEB00
MESFNGAVDPERAEHIQARARAASLLPGLVAAEAEHELPLVEWRLGPRGSLLGTVPGGGADAAHAWAHFFGAPVHDVPDLDTGAPTPEVATGLDDYRGVTVVVRSRL